MTGFTVDGLPGWDGGRDQRIHYIDWDNPLRNDFVVVSQFRVDIPGTQGRKCIVPDEVVFVNGIPLALAECKKPGSALGEAVKQHLRYADQRGAQPQEGNAKLFHTMQLLIATSGDKAALGSITSDLDRGMKEAELLQAIARVNRPAAGTKAAKKCGYVIDYVGITNHLAKALKAYAEEDVEGILKKLETDQVANLSAQLARVRAVFTDSNVTPGTFGEAVEDCVELLADGQLRDRFETELHLFLSTVDTVLPMPEAGPFLPAANLFAEIARHVRRRYRDTEDFDPSLYGEKVRELIDEHMTLLGVNIILPPISITDPDY